MSAHSRSQKFAQAAFPIVQGKNEEYQTFAKKFPALVHSCGLAQAVAFARAKQRDDYVGDLATVLQAVGHAAMTDAKGLDDEARKVSLSDYMRLSRDAIQAADWLKRYVEALEKPTETAKGVG